MRRRVRFARSISKIERHKNETHRRVVARASRCGGVYNGADEPSVVFCERREATEETKPFCVCKMVSREVSLEERIIP